MPEYHQIQTYLEFGLDFGAAINQVKMFLDHLGWLDLALQTWIENCEWDVADEVIVYSGALGREISANIVGETLSIHVILLGWTPKIIPELTTNCLELDLLFLTEDIEDDLALPKIRYYPGAAGSIWHLMQAMWNLFPSYGVFFTDEVQDGKPWQGILAEDDTKLWQFDLAILGSRYQGLYHPPRPGYFATKMEDQLWLARRFAWDKPLGNNP